MAHWTHELALIAAVAASSAWLAPRVLLPPLAHSAPAPTAPPHAPYRAPEIVIGDPAAEGVDSPAPQPPRAPNAALPALAEPDPQPDPGPARTHGTSRNPAAPTRFADGAITRRNGRWQVDLDQLQDPRQTLAGVHLQPLGQTEDGDGGDGFAITRTDSQGLLRAAGIRPGDVLVAVNDMPTLTPDQAIDALARARHATSLSFRFRRGATTFTVPVDTRGDARRLHGALVSSAGPVLGS